MRDIGHDTCDSIKSFRLSQVLTSTDWIESREGRHYMCNDILIMNGDNMFIIYFSTGNVPCSGPNPNPAPRIGPKL